MLTVYDKIQNACHQLNSDAYSLQIKNKKRLRQFLPCEKSLVLLACLREDTHFGMAIAVAARTKCNCHNALTEEMLWSMCFDDTAKKRHYGEERHLTPLALDGAHGGMLCEVVVEEDGGTKIYPIETASQ